MLPSSTNMFLQSVKRMPDAFAAVHGSKDYPEISGMVYFYQINGGTLLVAEIYGLPVRQGDSVSPVFGFHIHEGNSCTGDTQDPFADTKGHYNPRKKEHPYHAGDLPPLFGNGGFAWMMVFTDRFYVREVVGRTVVIHSHPDDFKSQPSGDSGAKIACGVIV